MRLVDLVVPLSDELQCHRFVEECLFVDIAGSEAAVLSTWRFMWKRSFCVVLSMPEHGDPAGTMKRTVEEVRRFVRNRFRKLPLLPPVETYLVLGCRSDAFERWSHEIPNLLDRSPLHLNRIAGAIVIDEDRFRSSATDDPQQPVRPGKHLGLIADVVARWCERRRAAAAGTV